MRRIESLTGLLLTEVFALRHHYNNRIAAHKAHHTMKKRKLAETSPRAKGRLERDHIEIRGA